MTDANGQGAAFDATARVDENDDIRRRLAEIEAQVTPEELARQAKRDELSRELYESERRVEGSAAHTAHVAQLRRLARDAGEAHEGAYLAWQKATEHAEGKHQALAEASETLRGIQELCESEGVSFDGVE